MRLLFFMFNIVLLLLFPTVAFCSEPWEEEFKNDELVDYTETDASVLIHPDGGYVELPSSSASAILQLKEDAYDQIILSSAGLEYFMFAGDGMIKNPALSYEIDGTGIAVRQDSYSTWVITDQEVYRLEFDGTGMTDNPFLKITGKTNILSISSQPYEDAFALLSQPDGNTGLIEYYTLSGGTMDVLVSFGDTPGEYGNPVDVAVIPETMDIVYATENAVLYYHFDGNSYVKNPFMSVTGLNNIKALSVHDGGFAVLSSDKKEHYLFTGEEMAYVESLSHELPADTVSLALKPDSYDFAIIETDGKTRYYRIEAGSYVEDLTLSAQAAPLETGLYTPRRYVSKQIELTKEMIIFELQVEETKPEDTDIRYFVKVDETEHEIIPDIPLVLDEPTSIVRVIAELSTEGENNPRVTKMTLQSYSMGIAYVKMDMFPVHPDYMGVEKPFTIYPEFPLGFPYLVDQNTLANPIPVAAGGIIIFDMKTAGDPESAKIYLHCTDPLIPGNIIMTLEKVAPNRWIGTYSIPEDAMLGAEFWLHHIRLEDNEDVMDMPDDGYMHMTFLQVVDHPEMSLHNFFNVYLTK